MIIASVFQFAKKQGFFSLSNDVIAYLVIVIISVIKEMFLFT